MSSRFWIACAGVMTCSIVAGFGLGGYAGGRDHGGPWQEGASDGSVVEGTLLADRSFDPAPDEASLAIASQDSGLQEPIVCKGCGPTLAERRMSADAYGTGTNDAVLQDYEAQGRIMDAAAIAPPPAVSATVDSSAGFGAAAGETLAAVQN
ncbi:hypothetical protein BH10PSE12_BH10PSE12_33260 [soil metagenome]